LAKAAKTGRRFEAETAKQRFGYEQAAKRIVKIRFDKRFKFFILSHTEEVRKENGG